MSDFIKGIGAVTLMLSIVAVISLTTCWLIEWYFTWIFSISGRKKRQEKPSDATLPDLVVLPNVSFRKELIKHVYTVTRHFDDCTIIRFRIPRFLGAYDEQKAKVNLSYEETIKILNSY